MSFILDALKKAESERSRNLGPVLMDVRIAPTRQRLPTWAWVLGSVLLANLLVLAWLLLRKPAESSADPTAAAVAPSITPAQPAAPALPPSIPVQPTLSPAPATVMTETPPLPPAAPIAVQPLYVDNLPTLQDLLASGVTLPALQMNMHAYDETPGNSYVWLNSRRLREGDEVSEGIRIERITARGVVLNAYGRRFVLPSGG